MNTITTRRHYFSGISVEHVAGVCVYLFALSWPLGAYQRIYGPIHLHHLALVPIVLSAGLDLKRNKRLRTPFELWWPCVVISILALLFNGTNALNIAALCLVFVVLAHGIRNREMALRTLHFSVISGCVMMVLSLLAQMNLVYPTSFSLDTGWVMAGPYSVAEGLFTATVCLLLIPALVTAAKNKEYAAGYFGLVIWVTLPVVLALFCFLSPRIELRALHPGYGIFLVPLVFPVVVFIWGLARVTAKLWVARKFMVSGVYGWLMAALLSATLLALWFMPSPTTGLVFLLAVIAGYGQPYVVPAPRTRLIPIFGLAISGLVLLNLVFSLPGDPRNYERVAQTALANNSTDALYEHLNFVKKIAPEEARADYYIARAQLAEGNLSAAAQTFAYALRDTQPRLLPVPDETLIDGFLDEMREKSSALPETVRGLAYEKALIAAGREHHALSLLELRGESSEDESLASWPLAAALATLLDAPQLVDTLKDWNAGLLATVLESVGPNSQLFTAPEGFPDNLLPFIAMMRLDEEGDVIHVFSPAGETGGIRISDTDAPGFKDIALPFSVPEWREWRQNADGVWTLAFGKVAEIHIMNTPEIYFSVYPTPQESYTDEFWEVAIFMPGQE